MTTHSSATMREAKPHETETTQITISDALRRRAQTVIKRQDDRSTVAQHYPLRIGDKRSVACRPRAAC